MLSLSLPCFAAVIEPDTPQWDNTIAVRCTIEFNGTTGSVSCSIIGKAGTTSISGTLTLYKGNIEIQSWELDGTSAVSVSDTFTGVSGSTYMLILDADVTRNGVVESINESDSAKCS